MGLSGSFDELYHPGGPTGGYDPLNQLTYFKRGTLNGARDDITSPTGTLGWTLDAQGNWSTLTTNGTPVNRTHNAQNQVTAVSGSGLTFDHNGNLLTDNAGKTHRPQAEGSRLGPGVSCGHPHGRAG